MTKQNSLRIVKLSDGSELIGNINLTDEESQFLRITDPLEILLNSKAIGVGMVEDFTSLRPWMQFANDSVFSIPKERIITICNVADDMKSYYSVIIEKVKQRAKIKKTPLTDEDIKRAADLISEMGREADDLMQEELSEEDYNTYFPSKKTLH
jgi:hypothetical protein|tara:strand:- start:24 stop:482 length:459 start_codon:yes stop_codon:yes gene_type:complete